MTTGLLEAPMDLGRNQRRQAGVLRLRPQGRSLDKGNYLATSDPFCAPTEFLRKQQEFWKRKSRLRLREEITESLRSVVWRVDVHGREHIEWGNWSPARDIRRLEDCQTQWRGFKARCCNSQAVAVPIGCNHRLCPLCNAQRLEKFRAPVRRMIAAMTHPTFLTLTVPNASRLTRKTFAVIRAHWKRFQAEQGDYVRGGIYAIEATYNRAARTWHPHIHVVFDAPWKLAGMSHKQFSEFKARLEFAWLRATSPEARIGLQG